MTNSVIDYLAEEIKKDDKQYMEDIKYFWEEKGDIERLSWFNLNKLKELDWRVANAYMNYIQAKETLDFNISKIND